MPGSILKLWRKIWLPFNGRTALGRMASRFAAYGTAPLHGRAPLARTASRGYIASSASMLHPSVHLGEHVLVSDNTIFRYVKDGGAINLHDHVCLYGNTLLQTGANGRITIGKHSHIQTDCHIASYLGEILIGEKVEIAPACSFYNYDHGTKAGVPIMDQPLTSSGNITVGDGAWLGHGVTVLGNVDIGDGAVIAAGAVVTKSIPANAIAAGVPAKVLRYRI